MKLEQGFSLPEFLIIVCAVGLISLGGLFVYKYQSNPRTRSTALTSQTLTYTYVNLSAANSQDIVNYFSNAVAKSFQTVDSLVCNGMPSECPSTPSTTIASITNSGPVAPPRLVSGYSFYVIPDTNASDQLDLEANSETSLQPVKNYLNKLISVEKFSSTTSLLNSRAEPYNDGTSAYATFYNNSSICELDEIASGEINLSCAPMNSYLSTAKMLNPIFDAFVGMNKRFSDPQANGLWLELSPNEFDTYDSYISNSQTSGYQTATLTLEVLSPTHPNYNSSLDGDPQFFWAKGNNWSGLPNVPSELPDGTNLGTLPCAYEFPNADAQQAYIGQPCQEQDQQDTMSTFQ